ncbi:MAG: cupin domain-containing protein [Hyphomicrobium zavarzinii]|uniref:ChrR family anti-sigma-E factor n=1 Tax=Hyphomicrobium zavarzinii TaxID=48292 RepID=UPI001A3A6AD4|nr:ChrR family anti-sigma-E factor [Hyphomicrobium zavarzinii]MBL8847050.1 cupin domain-containing protein [Hyphomicrobium zavarzinii]
MTISHHPDIANLMCCAAGSQPEAFAAVIASHLSLCKTCCCEVRRMQQIGVALFDKLEPVGMSGPAPVVAMRAGEADADAKGDPSSGSAPAPCGQNAGEVPRPLVPLIGADLDQVAWRWVAPGIWIFPVPLSKGCCGELRLIKVAPGKTMPEHGHAGQELTLILRGSYTDAFGTYRVGDVADLDEGVAHGPVACPEKGCICLMATEGKLIFKSPVARLLQPLLGL